MERRFSVQDARRAGLWGRPGPWSQYPQRMLQMRARAFALRDAFADVLGGLYLREELEDADAGGRWASPAPLRAPPPAPPETSTPPAAAGSTSPRRGGRDPIRPGRRGVAAETPPQPPEIADPPSRCRRRDPAAAAIVSPPRPSRAALSTSHRACSRGGARLPARALRSRYAQGWSVRQPRTLAAERPTRLARAAAPALADTGSTGADANMLAGSAGCLDDSAAGKPQPVRPSPRPKRTQCPLAGQPTAKQQAHPRSRRTIPRRSSPITTMPCPAPATRRSSPRSTRSSSPSSTRSRASTAPGRIAPGTATPPALPRWPAGRDGAAP